MKKEYFDGLSGGVCEICVVGMVGGEKSRIFKKTFGY